MRRRCGSSAACRPWRNSPTRTTTEAPSRWTCARRCVAAPCGPPRRSMRACAPRRRPMAEARSELHLWWLGQPAQPVYVGTLREVRTLRGVSLRYGGHWLARGFALSEDLPLIDQEFLPQDKDTAAGAVDDARPDRWGERVIRVIDKPPRLSLLEYLYFAGDDRFGALGVSTSGEQYLPRRVGPMPSLKDAAEIHELIRKLLANEPIQDAEKRLLAPGVSMGGARPKALVGIGGDQWVLK